MRYWLLGRSRTVRVAVRSMQDAAAEIGWPAAVSEFVHLVLAI